MKTSVGREGDKSFCSLRFVFVWANVSFLHVFFISNAFFNSALVLLKFFMNWTSNVP